MTTFIVQQVAVGETDLGEDAAHHAQVRRLSVGDSVAVTDGRGHVGVGQVDSLGKRSLIVIVDRVRAVLAPPAVHLFLPVADRDRMLWLAEKATELQIASWNPVMYRRSRSVTPRGEGDIFDRKARARMVSALEQSGGAWLPAMSPVIDVEAMPSVAPGSRYLLERGCAPLGIAKSLAAPVSLAIGPEGGFDAEEVWLLDQSGWTGASLGNVTLRFETAAIAAVAVARAALAP